MFEDLRLELQQAEHNLHALELLSNKIVEERNEQIDRRNNWNSLLYDEDKLKASAIHSALSTIEYRAEEILLEEARTAIESVEEFSISKSPEFWTKLEDAILNEETIFVEAVDLETIIVTIDLDKTAGTLEEYAQGVQYARERLEEEYPRKKKYDPVKASQRWKQIYQAGGTFYTKIINWRLQYFGERAPFWRLINDGVPQPLGEGIDLGGTAYPTSKPTRFKEKSERRIASIIESEIRGAVQHWKNKARDGAKDARDKIAVLENLFELTSSMILEAAPEFRKAEAKVEDQLEEYGEDRLERADPEKLNKLIAEITGGTADPHKRYYLQRRGDKPFKVRIQRLIKELNLEINK